MCKPLGHPGLITAIFWQITTKRKNFFFPKVIISITAHVEQNTWPFLSPNLTPGVCSVTKQLTRACHASRSSMVLNWVLKPFGECSTRSLVTEYTLDVFRNCPLGESEGFDFLRRHVNAKLCKSCVTTQPTIIYLFWNIKKIDQRSSHFGQNSTWPHCGKACHLSPTTINVVVYTTSQKF